MTRPLLALSALWHDAGLAAAALDRVELTGADPYLASSFAVGTAAQVASAAAGACAALIGEARNGVRQRVAVDLADAAREACLPFTLDGVAPPTWDKLAGLYPCRHGAVRVHTNFAHHRDGLLRLLGLPEGEATERAAVAAALARHEPVEFEQAATAAGLVVAAVRDFADWDMLPQAAVVAAQPLVAVERIGDAPPRPWPALGTADRPLTGLRVLDLTRILAGPIAGRTLAAFGADVMLVNAPHLPNIDAIADTSRGKLSAHADLRSAAGREALGAVLADADVFMQGYRPGALAALGFGDEAVARRRPGIVTASLSAYGETGPWGTKRGFDSLVQSAMGFNLAEGEAARQAGAVPSGAPRALPMQVLDMASGALLAFGIEAALLRQRQQGGSWAVRVSLARTGLWLRSLGRVADGFAVAAADFGPVLETAPSGFGELVSVRPSVRFSMTPAGYARESMPPGSHPLAWPQMPQGA